MSLGPLTGLPAPEWALGELGRGPGATENQFSLVDARLYQLRSLIEAAPEERERQAALMFRSLGQVIHLLQDMAQPQHTRNDIHPACDSLLESVIPEHSFYESYIEQRVRGARFRGRSTGSAPDRRLSCAKLHDGAVLLHGRWPARSRRLLQSQLLHDADQSLDLADSMRGSDRATLSGRRLHAARCPAPGQDRAGAHRPGEGEAVPSHDARSRHGRLDSGRGREQSLGLGPASPAARQPAEVLPERPELRLHQRGPAAAGGRLRGGAARSFLRGSARGQCPACR